MYYEKRNLENINKLAPNTKEMALAWHNYCKLHQINILIYETIRSEAQQRENVKKGASQTMKSYHLVGQALDFVPVNGKGETLWNGYEAKLIQQAIRYAKELGFEWGGDWKSFVDKPHLQYNYKGYGTDKALTVSTANKKEEQKVAKRDINKVSAWAEKDWIEATENGYFDGTRPGAPITREEAAIVINRLRQNLSKRK